MRPRKGKYGTCLVCEKEIYSRPYEVNIKKYCSNRCRIIYSKRNQVVLVCKQCGKEYNRAVSQIKWRGSSFCSYSCGAVYRFTGNRNHAWKGGVSTENHSLRASKRWKEWREAVFKRDNYTCQMCKKLGGYLEPHHIKPFYKYKELRFNVDNGVTLCKKCHRMETRMGRPVAGS